MRISTVARQKSESAFGQKGNPPKRMPSIHDIALVQGRICFVLSPVVEGYRQKDFAVMAVSAMAFLFKNAPSFNQHSVN